MNSVVRTFLLRAGVLLGLAIPTLAPASAQADGPAAGPDPVSRLVRDALARPHDPAAWTGLAEALPELALTRDADPVTVFEASRLADSLAAVPVEPNPAATRFPAPPSAAGRASGPGGVRSWAGTRIRKAADALSAGGLTPSDAAALAPWFLVVILLVAGPLLSRVRARRPSGRRGKPHRQDPEVDSTRQGPVPGVSPRLWTVTTLADDGLSPAEIARRTGMAQDAVQVLLGLRSASVPPGTRNMPRGVGDTGHPYSTHLGATAAPRAARPPSLTERAAGIATLRNELTRDARRLKGGRLTYGAGGNP